MCDLKIQQQIFKAYREGKSAKVPKNKINRSFDEVKDAENYGAICQDDVVDISVDDVDMFEALLDVLDELNLKTYALYSPHGGHTYWRKHGDITDGKDILTAGSFTVDIHSKGTYIPLKCDGKLREEVYHNVIDIPELPKFLYPVKGKNKLWQMSEGDGRNDEISKHIFKLHGMTKDDIINIVNIINDHILKVPLDASELSVILRDDTFDKIQTSSFFEGRQFMHNIFGDYLINKHKIVMIDKQLHMFNGQIYEHVDENDNIFNAMIDEIAFLKDSSRNEVLKYMKIRCRKCEMADERYIAFKNGIYDLYESKLIDFTPNIYITTQIPWDYDKDAYSKVVDDTLNAISVDDKEVRKLLEECIGYCFYRRNELGSSFFLVGDKSNGKSTFLKMIKNMLGKKNYSPLDLSELSERFNTAMMYGKLANIGDDIDDEYLSGSKVAIFKKLVTGDTIKAEEKNQPVFMFEPFCKLFFAANEMPRIKDKTGAVLRRIVIVPFNAVFDKNNPTFKHNIIKDLITKDATEYLIKIGIDGLHDILDRQNFTQPEKVKQELANYQRDNDTVIQFVDDLANGIDDILNEDSADVYAKYQTFCAQNGFRHVNTKNTFTSSLKKNYDISTVVSRIDKKCRRIYVKN